MASDSSDSTWMLWVGGAIAAIAVGALLFKDKICEMVQVPLLCPSGADALIKPESQTADPPIPQKAQNEAIFDFDSICVQVKCKGKCMSGADTSRTCTDCVMHNCGQQLAQYVKFDPSLRASMPGGSVFTSDARKAKALRAIRSRYTEERPGYVTTLPKENRISLS